MSSNIANLLSKLSSYFNVPGIYEAIGKYIPTSVSSHCTAIALFLMRVNQATSYTIEKSQNNTSKQGIKPRAKSVVGHKAGFFRVVNKEEDGHVDSTLHATRITRSSHEIYHGSTKKRAPKILMHHTDLHRA